MCWKLNQESQESYWWSESRHPPDKLVKKMISLTNIIKTDNKERLRPLRKWKDPKKHRLYQLLWVLIEDRLSRKMVLETVENEKNEIICDQENIACKKGEDINTFQRWKTTSMPWFRLIQRSGIHFFAKVPKWASSFYMWIYHMNVICCHWIWPEKQLIEGIFCKINRTRRPFYTISYVSSRKTTQKWFSEMSFSVEPPQQDHPTLWYLSNLSGKFQTSYFLYILNRSVSGISLWPLKLIPIECQSNIICCI